MASLAPVARFQALDSNGDALPGALLYTYESGGSTPLSTYTSQTALVANANPVVCDAGGFADVWLATGSQYRFTLKSSTSTAVWGPIDNLIGQESNTIRVQKFIGGTDFTAGSSTQLTMSYAPGAENNTQIFFDGVYQDKSQYSVSSSTVTFTDAIPTATVAVEIIYTVNQGATTYLVPADIGVTVAALTGTNSATENLIICASDETTALTAGTAKVTFRMPYAFTLSAVRASLSTAQTSGNIFTVDINDSGTTILSTKLTIDNGESTSTTAATAAVISDSALADDAAITIDIDQIGDSTAKGLKVVLIGKKT